MHGALLLNERTVFGAGSYDNDPHAQLRGHYKWGMDPGLVPSSYRFFFALTRLKTVSMMEAADFGVRFRRRPLMARSFWDELEITKACRWWVGAHPSGPFYFGQRTAGCADLGAVDQRHAAQEGSRKMADGNRTRVPAVTGRCSGR